MRKVNLLDGLTDHEVLTLADSVVEESFEPGEVVCRQGETNDQLSILKSGTASCTQTNARGDQVPVAALQPGDYFGKCFLLFTFTSMVTLSFPPGEDRFREGVNPKTDTVTVTAGPEVIGQLPKSFAFFVR